MLGRDSSSKNFLQAFEYPSDLADLARDLACFDHISDLFGVALLPPRNEVDVNMTEDPRCCRDRLHVCINALILPVNEEKHVRDTSEPQR